MEKRTEKLMDRMYNAFQNMASLCGDNLPDDPGWQDYVDECNERYQDACDSFDEAFDALKAVLAKSESERPKISKIECTDQGAHDDEPEEQANADGKNDQKDDWNRFVIPLQDGYSMCAEQGHDPSYPGEIYISLIHPDGYDQMLALVQEAYDYEDDSDEPVFNLDQFNIMVSHYDDFDDHYQTINPLTEANEMFDAD